MNRRQRKKWMVIGAVFAVLAAGWFLAGSVVADAAVAIYYHIYYSLQPAKQDLSEPGFTNQKDLVIDEFGRELRIRIQDLYADSSQLSFAMYLEGERGLRNKVHEGWVEISFTDPNGKEIKTTDTTWDYGKDASGKIVTFYSTRFLSPTVPEKMYLMIQVTSIRDRIYMKKILVDRTKLEKQAKILPGSKDFFIAPDGMKIQPDRLELKPGMSKVRIKAIPAGTKSPFTLVYEVKDDKGNVVGTHLTDGNPSSMSFHSTVVQEKGTWVHEAEFHQFPESSKYLFHLKEIRYEIPLNQTIVLKGKKEASFPLQGGTLVVKNVRQSPNAIRLTIEFVSSLPTQHVILALADSQSSIMNPKWTKTKDGKFLYTADVIFHKKVDLAKPLQLKLTNLSQTVPVDWTATFQN